MLRVCKHVFRCINVCGNKLSSANGNVFRLVEVFDTYLRCVDVSDNKLSQLTRWLAKFTIDLILLLNAVSFVVNQASIEQECFG